jgi:hypothetical protein
MAGLELAREGAARLDQDTPYGPIQLQATTHIEVSLAS